MEKNKKEQNKIIKVLLLCLIIIIFLCLFGFGINKIIKSITSPKKDELTLYLEDMGKEFYEEFYYEQLGSTLKEKEKFLSQYKDIGIKISLSTLSKYRGNKFKNMIDKFINKDTKEQCNINTTKVIIYPKAPYEKDSYKMVTEIEC